MRIIAGDYKGRRLESPKDNRVRPTTDKVKEALFSIIAEYLPDAIVVDLFAGSGNLGLEALSRGAKRCYFCDNSRDSINLVRQNVNYCRAEDKSVIVAGDFRNAINRVQGKADIFFLDPPYKKGFLESCFEAIAEADKLAENGIIIAEHGSDEVLPETMAGFTMIKERKYGKIVITIFG